MTFTDAADSSIRLATVTDEFGVYLLIFSTGLEANSATPTAFTLEQNYPDPFSSLTFVSCTLVQPGPALLTIYDVLGREVRRYTPGLWWYLVRYYGPIDKNGTVTKRGYVMSHFARFVRPGCQRVEVAENPRPAVHLSACQEGAQVVIVALNMGTTTVEQPISLSGGAVPAFTPYVTTASKNCVVGSAITAGSGRFTVQLEPSSITTLAGT